MENRFALLNFSKSCVVVQFCVSTFLDDILGTSGSGQLTLKADTSIWRLRVLDPLRCSVFTFLRRPFAVVSQIFATRRITRTISPPLLPSIQQSPPCICASSTSSCQRRRSPLNAPTRWKNPSNMPTMEDPNPDQGLPLQMVNAETSRGPAKDDDWKYKVFSLPKENGQEILGLDADQELGSAATLCQQCTIMLNNLPTLFNDKISPYVRTNRNHERSLETFSFEGCRICTLFLCKLDTQMYFRAPYTLEKFAGVTRSVTVYIAAGYGCIWMKCSIAQIVAEVSIKFDCRTTGMYA